MQEWTSTEDVAGVDITGVDNDGGSCRGGLQEWTMTEEKRNRWTMTEWISQS